VSGCQRRGQISGEKENSIFLSLDCFGAQHLNLDPTERKQQNLKRPNSNWNVIKANLIQQEAEKFYLELTT